MPKHRRIQKLINFNLKIMFTNKNLFNNACKLVLVAVLFFILYYVVSSFSNWEIDCSKWSILARWGVIWGAMLSTILFYIFSKK